MANRCVARSYPPPGNYEDNGIRGAKAVCIKTLRTNRKSASRRGVPSAPWNDTSAQPSNKLARAKGLRSHTRSKSPTNTLLFVWQQGSPKRNEPDVDFVIEMAMGRPKNPKSSTKNPQN